MSEFTFTFYSEPVAQGRPRFTARTGFVKAIDPEKSRNYKTALRSEAIRHLQETHGRQLEGALTLSLTVYRSIPQSWSKKKQEQARNGIIEPTSKPDTDNYIKCVQDALNGLIFVDDSQITTINASKKYADVPRVEISIREN